jgi:hypothetical protein
MPARTTLCLVLALACPLPAQSLAAALPASTLVYFRQTDVLGGFQRVLGSTLLWDQPIDVEKEVFGPMDAALGQADEMLGIQVGSISAYLRSIKLIEGGLLSFTMTDGMPEFDFVLLVQSTMAQEIYDLLSGRLIEEQIAERLGENELSVNIADMFGIAIGRDGDRLVVASDEIRMRAALKGIAGAPADSLAKALAFQAVASTAPKDQVFYSRIDSWLQMARENAPRFSRRSSGPIAAAESLGLFKLLAGGLVDDEATTRLALRASEEIPIFDFFTCKGATPAALGELPAETVFGITYGGDLTVVWKKVSSLLLDAKKFPFAGEVERAIAEFQQMSGFKVEELARLGVHGTTFAVLPDRHGRIDDDPECFVFIGRHDDPAFARELADRFVERMKAREHVEFTTREEGGQLWYVASREGSDDRMCMVLGADQVLVSEEHVIRRLFDIRSGKEPGLAAHGALKGLKPGAAAYTFLGLKSILGTNREFGPAYARAKDAAGVAATVEMTGTSVVVTTNQSLGQVMGAFAAAGALYEVQEVSRDQVSADLKAIAKAYREFRGKHERNPKSTEEMGFTGEKELRFPPDRRPGDRGQAYVVLDAPAPSEQLTEGQIIVAHTPDASLGRVVVYLNGDVRNLSEANFRRALANQASGR